MKHSTFLLTGLSLIAVIMGVSQSALAQFSQIEPYIEEISKEPIVENYKKPLLQAISFHNILFQINHLLNATIPIHEEEVAKYALSEAQNKALKECMLQSLSKVYNNSEEAYNNIQNVYNDKLKTLTVYINETGETTTSTDNAETYPYWRVAREVLMDVYQNPKKYGNSKSDFPLWTDQKYLYTQNVNSILSQVQKKFTLPEMNGQVPLVQNKAFNNGLAQHLNAFSQQNGILNTLDYNTNSKKYADLLNYVKQHPQYESLKAGLVSALPQLPDPLPPYYEIIQLTDDPAQTGTIFPEWPSPWAEYIRRGLNNRAIGGEMDTCFLPNSITLRPDVRNWDKYKINNTLSLTKEKNEELENIKQSVDDTQEMIDKTIADINQKLAENGIDQKLDLKINNTTEIQKTLINAKKEALTKARSLYAQKAQPDNTDLSQDTLLNVLNGVDPNSEEYQKIMDQMNSAQNSSDEKFMNDLEKDMEGMALQNNISTNDALQNIESQKAQYALQKETREEAEKERNISWAKHIDMLTCINQGVNSAKP